MTDRDTLVSWFFHHKRSFPWRKTTSPYAVWISEVMLQQTRASVVVPYFERWMEQFPTVAHLAEATLEEVIKAWEGLGYYQRARNIHKAAEQIMRDFSGQIPSDEQRLKTVKGLGEYTRGAIRSFGFKQQAVAIDGNVRRVLARLQCTDDKAAIEAACHAIIEGDSPWIVMEALIELGALVCRPRPRCEACPLAKGCRAKSEGRIEAFPAPKLKAAQIRLERTVCVLFSENALLLKKNSAGLMADLWEFPWLEGKNDADQAADWLFQHLHIEANVKRALQIQKCSFTKYTATLHPFLFEGKEQKPIKEYQWVEAKELHRLSFSSGHRKICASCM